MKRQIRILYCNHIEDNVECETKFKEMKSANRGLLGFYPIESNCSGFDKCNKEFCMRRNINGKEDYAVFK